MGIIRAMPQKPTIGRIVHFIPDVQALVPNLKLPHRAAIVTDVLQDGRPMLKVFDPTANDTVASAVEEDPTGTRPGTWHWPERD